MISKTYSSVHLGTQYQQPPETSDFRAYIYKQNYSFIKDVREASQDNCLFKVYLFPKPDVIMCIQQVLFPTTPPSKYHNTFVEMCTSRLFSSECSGWDLEVCPICASTLMIRRLASYFLGNQCFVNEYWLLQKSTKPNHQQQSWCIATMFILHFFYSQVEKKFTYSMVNFRYTSRYD